MTSRRRASPASDTIGLRLTLYGRSDCHLCDEMLAALESLRAEFAFVVDVVDVDSDAALEQRFGMLVPVLAHAGKELCHYHLDAEKVRAHLGSAIGPASACLR